MPAKKKPAKKLADEEKPEDVFRHCPHCHKKTKHVPGAAPPEVCGQCGKSLLLVANVAPSANVKDKLTPLPLSLADKSETVLDARGAAIANFYHGSTDELRQMARSEAEFHILARNAFAALELGVVPIHGVDGGWTCAFPLAWAKDLVSYPAKRHADAFTALADYYLWHVQTAQTGAAHPDS